MIELPGAPEIKVILLATNVIRVSGNKRKRLRKKKAVASTQEHEKQRDLFWNYGDIMGNYVFQQTHKMR